MLSCLVVHQNMEDVLWLVRAGSLPLGGAREPLPLQQEVAERWGEGPGRKERRGGAVHGGLAKTRGGLIRSVC